MSNTNALLDRARKMCSPQTDYQLAKRLGIGYATISRCRHHKGTLDNKGALKLSTMMGVSFEDVVKLIELDRARRPEDRSFWEHVAPRLLPTVLIAALLTSVGSYVTQGRAVSLTADQANHYAN